MNSILYGTVAVAALVSQVSASPSSYDSVKMGCTIPTEGFKGHGAPAVNEAITIIVMAGTAPVTEFIPGAEHTIEVPGYNGTVNMWIHASDGVMVGADEATHPQAAACMEAAFSADPGATHSFIWTAPETTDPVTISVAQATYPGDNYNTNTLDLLAGAAAPAGAAEAEEAPMTTTDAPVTATDAPVTATDAPATATDAPATATDAPATETPPAPAEGAEGATPAETGDGETPAVGGAAGVATGAFAAAAAAVVALAF